MFSKSAEIYDQIYFQFKDYGAEAQSIGDLIAQKRPSARTVLDVACGTGEHAKILRERYAFEVDGIDLEEKFVRLAQRKNPDGFFVQADMVDFALGKSYDVVMCLFSSIGYLITLERVACALKRFKAHTNPGGLIVVEPWFQPGALTPGKIFLNTAQSDELTVARMAYNQVQDRISTLHFEYLIGTPGKIEHEIEKHELGLFTVDEMLNCFREAGLQAAYDAEGLSGRGLYVAAAG